MENRYRRSLVQVVGVELRPIDCDSVAPTWSATPRRRRLASGCRGVPASGCSDVAVEIRPPPESPGSFHYARCRSQNEFSTELSLSTRLVRATTSGRELRKSA